MRSHPARSLLACLGLALCLSLPAPAAAGRLGRAPDRPRASAPAAREAGGIWVAWIGYLVKLLDPAAAASSIPTASPRTPIPLPQPMPPEEGRGPDGTEHGVTLDPNG